MSADPKAGAPRAMRLAPYQTDKVIEGVVVRPSTLRRVRLRVAMAFVIGGLLAAIYPVLSAAQQTARAQTLERELAEARASLAAQSDAALEEAVSAIEESAAAMRGQLAAMEQMSARIEALKQSELREQLTQSEADLSAVLDSRQTITAERDALQAALAESESESDSLAAELAQARETETGLRQEMAALSDAAAQAALAAQQAQEALQGEMNAKLTEAQAREDALSAALDAARDSFESRRADLEQRIAAAQSAAEAQEADMSGQIADLEGELDQARVDFEAALQEARDAAAQADANAQALRVELEALTVTVELAEADRAAAEERAEAMADAVAITQFELEEFSSAAAERERALTAELTATQTSLTETVAAAEEAAQAAAETEADLAARLAAVSDESERQSGEIERLNADLTEAAAREDYLIGRLSQTEETLMASQNRSADLETRLGDTQTELSNTRDALSDAGQKLRDLGERLALAQTNFESQFNAAQSEIRRVTGERDGLREEVADYEAETDALRAYSEQLETDLNQARQTSRQQLALAQEEALAAGDQIDSLIQRVSELEAHRISAELMSEQVKSLRRRLSIMQASGAAQECPANTAPADENAYMSLARIRMEGLDQFREQGAGALSPEGRGVTDVIAPLDCRIRSARALLTRNAGRFDDPDERLFWRRYDIMLGGGGAASFTDLGRRYAEGEGVRKDPALALQLLRVGAMLGDDEGRRLALNLLESGELGDIPPAILAQYRQP